MANIKQKSWSPMDGPQTEVLQLSATEVTEILFGGSRGGGKSDAGLAWLSEPEYIMHPEFRSLVIRKDYDDLNDWIFRAKMFYRGHAEITGKPAVIHWKAGGETRLGHWKDKDTISKYLGHEYQKMLFEELTQGIGTLEEYQMLLGSLRSTVEELVPQVFCTTNPGGRGHLWVKEYFVDKSTGEIYEDPISKRCRIFIPSSVYDNKHLVEKDPGYIKWLESLEGDLRKMWLEGSWDVFEGQFFVNVGDVEESYRLNESDLEGALFGSLDGGTTHGTSFGMWHVDRDNKIHRLMSYLNNGGTHKSHCTEIYDRIESFPWTKGRFPDVIVADPALWTKYRLSDEVVRSPIDEYIDYFRLKGRKTIFQPANNQKENGCQIMKMLFKGENGVSDIRVWEKYNKSYLEGLRLVQTDKNNVEIYQKADGDDAADEARYGIVYCNSVIGQIKQNSIARREPTRLERLLRGDMKHHKTVELDWYNA